MKFKPVLTTVALMTAMVSSSVMADNALTATQKKEVETIIHQYLVTNPDVLLEASQALQQKQQDTLQKEAKNVIEANAAELFTDKMTQTGNPNGTVTLVEFFDYQCIHCKKMAPVISDLIQKNKNLRVIYKEFPIFGASSDMASRAVLAAGMQGKYHALQEALLKQSKHLTPVLVDEAAKSVGLNMDTLKKDMASPAIAQALKANHLLAEKLHLMGTPAFIIAATPGGKLKPGSEPVLIPGGASEEALQALIQKMAG